MSLQVIQNTDLCACNGLVCGAGKSAECRENHLRQGENGEEVVCTSVYQVSINPKSGKIYESGGLRNRTYCVGSLNKRN